MVEKGDDYCARFSGQKSLKSKTFNAGLMSSAPAVVDMAIYHVAAGVAEIKIGETVYATLGEGQEFDTVLAGPKVKIQWRGKTAVTVSVLTGTRAVMEVVSPV